MLSSVLRKTMPLVLLLLSLSSLAQNRLPNTLLWRISGKGLPQSSYLYGTMHLPDKRLFQFGDSLYAALQRTDGYAMEINADEYVDSLFSGSVREAEEEALLKKRKVKLNRSKLGREADSLLKSVGVRGDVASKKDLKTLRNRRMMALLQSGEMPTIMDAYLLGLAKRLNKWTGGIEDVQDQLNLSDELGGALEPEAVLLPQAVFRTSIEQMLAVYLAQDLDKIDRISNASYSGQDRDAMLIHRNLKMAFRMDSLSHERPTFFAVGAAHLPGDSGVITLLRNRGFRVEPVFSSSTRFAGDFAAALPEATWSEVQDDDKSFTVHMPGKPGDYNISGSGAKMKMYFDLTTMTVYMAGSFSGPNVDASRLDQILRDAVQGMTGKKLPVKATDVASGDLLGREAFAENEDGSYRLRLFAQNKTVYMLLAGAVKKSNIGSADVARFFASFAAHKPVAKSNVWETFSLAGKGFSVLLPAAPSLNEAVDRSVQSEGPWQSATYNTADGKTGFFYMVQVREPKPGFAIQNDSAYFDGLVEEVEKKVDKLLQVRRDTVQGCASLFVQGYLKKFDGIYNTRHIIRGSRVYTLIVGFPKGSDTADAERFLNSFQLQPYEAVPLTSQGISGFATTAPAAFKQSPPDTTAAQRLFSANYTAVNPTSGVSYEVQKHVVSPTYWASSDSAFLHANLGQYKSYNDSVLQTTWVSNGGVKGLEAWIKLPGHNSLRKLRLMVNADTLYTLYSSVPVQDTGLAEHRRVFDDFRLATERAPTIYTPKTAALLQVLQTGDSTDFADAAENLSLAQFTKADLPLLHAALRYRYRDSADYRSVNEGLVDAVRELADSSTAAFVQTEYNLPALKGSPSQYDLLAVLAGVKTQSSYALLQQLLLTATPTTGDADQLRSALLDSMQLTASLYPALLQKAGDSLLGYSVVMLANRLLDSSLLAPADLQPYAGQLLQGARRAAAQLNGEDAWSFTIWAEMLSALNTTDGNKLLQKALAVKEPYLKKSVVLALLKNNQPVPAAHIATVAADKGQRGSFYEEMVKLKKESLFPALYATQKSLAESEVHNVVSDELEDGEFSLTYIGERTESFGGTKGRFYLFRLRTAYNDEERKENFLAVAGPYALTGKEKLVWSKASGFWMEETLTPTNLPRLLKAYLAQYESAEKE